MATRFDADGEDYTRATTLNSGTCTFTCWVIIDVDRNTFSSAWNIDDGVAALQLQTDSDGVSWIIFDTTTGISSLFTGTVGTWYFIAVSKQTGASATVAYWADATAALSSATSTHAVSASMTNLQIGESFATNEWLNGRIAALKIWNGVALTQAEIENERFQYSPRRTANLHGFYPFLQGGATAGAQQDFSGNGNTLSGGTSSSTTDGPPIPWRTYARKTFIPPEEVETVKGTDILDFGAFPGKSDTSVVITGQTGIISGSLVEAWIRPDTTADHSPDEHIVETLHVFARDIVAGTGFTIYGVNTSQLNEPNPQGAQQARQGGGAGTRIYGQWRVAWAWA